VKPRAARRLNVPMITAAVATVLCAGLVAGHGDRWWRLPTLDKLERTSIDARWQLRGPRRPVDDRIVIVGIDDATRQRHPELTQTRRGWAKFFDALHGYAPDVVALDLFFSSREIILPDALAERVRAADAALPADAPGRDVIHDVAEELRGDELLAAAIARSGNVFLGMFFDTTPGDGPVEERKGTELARYGESAIAGGDNQPARAFGVSATRPEIGAGAAGGGLINVVADEDGVVRRMPMAVQHGDRHYMPLGLAVALAALGSRDSTYVAGGDTVSAGGRTFPLGPNASAMVDFLGPGKTFPHVSAADVIDGTAPREALEGKLVFVGYTFGASDKAATPFDQLADGVELHATLTHNLLHGELMRPGGRGLTVLAILLLGAIVTATQLRPVRRRSWVPAVVASVLVVLWCGFAYVELTRRVVVEMVAPLAATLGIALAAGIAALATEGREKMRLRAAFSQYVSSTLVERILSTPGLAHLGGERRELSVLFSDIRGFSKIAETLDPEDLATFLNEYLTPMTEIVLESSGTLDKYIGDAVMAIWGAPIETPDHAERACAVALAMLGKLAAMNVRWRADGRPVVAIGIGINTGAMAVGNMGSEARFDYTVLGDAVNLGSRLEALTKEYAVDILVGAETARAAGGKFAFRELDWVRVKGRGGMAAVFELLGPAGTAKPADLAAWADALAAYRARDFARAVELWGDLAVAHPDDGAARVMRERAEALRADPPPPDWDGVYEQRSK
jgi:adenylate cyclase